MIISHRDTAPRRGRSDHRPGGIGFIALLQGETGAIDNFDFSISITTEDFFTPRHRHNFDQVRYILKGEFSFDRGCVQKTGQVSYFGEGTYYEQKGIGETETLLLQTAGASGSGYMSFDQLYETAHELTRHGRFENGVYTWLDESGKKHNMDGYQAVWEKVSGRKLTYPRPRYDGPVLLNPENFAWIPVAGNPGVAMRELGCFHERGLALAQFSLQAGAAVSMTGHPARTLLFVEQGEGTANVEPIRRHSAVQIERGETVTIAATAPLILVRLRLPCFDQAMAA
jgi:mannose-6-phosphate isomerase-like protein (cupin superfamily)